MAEPTHKVALITGAGRGIGRAAALELASKGMGIVALSRTQHEVAKVVDLIQAQGGAAIALSCDVSQFDSLSVAVEEAVKQLGPISILVNNAAIIGPLAPTAQAEPEEWARALEINLIGAFYAARLVLPGMLEQQWGRIINVSSGAALGSGILHGSAYSVSKSGLDMLTRALAAELPADNIAVVSVYPGVVDTSMQLELRQAPAEQFGPSSERFHGLYERGDLIDPVLPGKLITALCGAAGETYHGQAIRISDPAGQQLVSASES